MNKSMLVFSKIKESVRVYGMYLFVLLLFSPSYDLVLYAQEPSNGSGSTISQNNLLQNSTNDGTLDVHLAPTPYPMTTNSELIRFKVSFLKPNTSQIQDHVDFNMRIFKDNKQVFQASNQTGQPTVPLHATDGYLTVPMLNYQFNQAGKYLIEIPVYGILFNPIRPESANFTIDVGS
jgi:hypothetical protein